MISVHFANGAGPAEHVDIMLTIILVVLLVLALGGGGWGHSRFGYASWSPLGLILIIFLVLYFTGGLHA